MKHNHRLTKTIAALLLIVLPGLSAADCAAEKPDASCNIRQIAIDTQKKAESTFQQNYEEELAKQAMQDPGFPSRETDSPPARALPPPPPPPRQQPPRPPQPNGTTPNGDQTDTPTPSIPWT